jgi:hypothetical protein
LGTFEVFTNFTYLIHWTASNVIRQYLYSVLFHKLSFMYFAKLQLTEFPYVSLLWLVPCPVSTVSNIPACYEDLGGVRHRPEQNRVTGETPSSEAFVPLQEPVGVLASYVPHAQMQV